MPEPVARGRRYMPGLDGVRALAVLGVLAYHLGFGWAPGGLLGVGVFFTLSGYLITDLLLADADGEGIRLRSFWGARARRLLPALFVMLVVVTVSVTLVGPHQTTDFRQAVGTAVAYVNNWWLIFHDVSYFEALEKPQPLNHLWSLSIEEQFYLVWPLLLLLALRFVPASRYGTRAKLAAGTIVLAIASSVLMAVIYSPDVDPSRVYYGTDTRAAELLVGAALAMLWPSRRLQPSISVSARRSLDIGGSVGLLIVLLLFWRSREFSPFLYRGGFLLLALASCLLVAAVVHPASRLAGVIGCRPMRWIGARSYGIYLWHFPITTLTSVESEASVDLGRAAAQVACTFLVAGLSWRYIEDPIRRGALNEIRRTIDPRRWRRGGLAAAEAVALATCAAVLAVAAAGLLGWNLRETAAKVPGRVTVSQTIETVDETAGDDRTVCDAVVHIGDSTSEGLVSEDYLPKEKWRISAQYARVGATKQHLEVSGARSIYERFNGLPNADDVAIAWRADGFRGCWVLALGTNEAANVAAGSEFSLDRRIDTMMETIGSQPVLWVNVRTIRTDSPYAEANMALWNAALLEACDRYPNMRIYDWASDVRDEWFIPDGIHFTTEGYRARSRLIARGLLEAFPESGAPADAGCVVHPELETGTSGPS